MKISKVSIILFIVTIIAIGGYFIFLQKNSYTNQQKASYNSVVSDQHNGWEAYKDDKLKFEFQYPPFSCEVQRAIGDTSFVACYLPKGQNGGPKGTIGAYTVSLGFISQEQLNVMGVTYCGAYPNDSSRCESLKIGGVNSIIDWGINVPITTYDSAGKEKESSEVRASVWIPHPGGGIVTFVLQPVIPESKTVLYEILSTFRFFALK